MDKKEYNELIVREFRKRKARQVYAVGVTVFLMVAMAWKHSHPGLLLRELSKTALLLSEVFVIAAFVIFSMINWRCPACSKYLGKDINKIICKKCGIGLR